MEATLLNLDLLEVIDNGMKLIPILILIIFNFIIIQLDLSCKYDS